MDKTAYYLFSGYYLWRTENFREKHFLSGFLDFFVNISTLAKGRVEVLTKKSRNLLRKWISLKIPVLPCSTLKRINNYVHMGINENEISELNKIHMYMYVVHTLCQLSDSTSCCFSNGFHIWLVIKSKTYM